MATHGLQPARPLCPWDSPSKNTGVGCHSLRQGIFPTQGPNLALLYCRRILYCLSHQGSPQGYAVLCLVAQSCLSLWDSAAHGLLCTWDSPGQNTGVGCHALLQGIFPIQGANPFLMFSSLAGGFSATNATWKALTISYVRESGPLK